MKTGEVLLQGCGLDGKPFALRRGGVALLTVLHDATCPGGRGRPDLCNCKPEVRLGKLRCKGAA